MKGNVLKTIAACAILGATIGFANAQNSWYHAVTHRSTKQSDKVRDQKYMQGLKRHHMYGRLDKFQDREGYTETRRDRTGGSRSTSDRIRDQKYMEGLARHKEYGRLDRFRDREGYGGDSNNDNSGLHKGWTKGRHNKHHGTGPGHYSG